MPTTLARAETPHGEVALRRRGDVLELIVDGVFAMDSVDTTSELALAEATPPDARRVLVGGLGLGFTAAHLLDIADRRESALPRLERVDVVELASPLLEWARSGVTEQLGRVAADPRVRLHADDVADFLAATDDVWDAVLLDVDNGPTFLVHGHNERLYTAPCLASALGRLTPGGVLGIWCETASPDLHACLAELAEVRTTEIPVQREERPFVYVLYTATKR